MSNQFARLIRPYMHRASLVTHILDMRPGSPTYGQRIPRPEGSSPVRLLGDRA